MPLPAPLPIQPHQERQTVSHTRIKKTGTYLGLGHLRINLPLCFIVIVVVMALGWWDHLRIHRYVPRGFVSRGFHGESRQRMHAVCDVGQDDERAGLGRLEVALDHITIIVSRGGMVRGELEDHMHRSKPVVPIRR